MDFEERIRALPKNRKTETVVTLRLLIKDMHESGMSAAAVGRALGKDHTTILHHLWYMGVNPADRMLETARAAIQRKVSRVDYTIRKLEKRLEQAHAKRHELLASYPQNRSVLRSDDA